MKIVALEEHFATPEVMAAWRALGPESRDLAMKHSTAGEVERRLLDLGADRVRAMDAAGVNVQVLSLTAPGVQNLDPEEAVALARSANDLLAATVRARPDRFRGLATLATPDPAEAARELHRCVRELGFDGAMLYGRTRDRNLDHPDFRPIFEAAAELRAPIYLHPQSPPPAVRAAYYEGFGEPLDALFASPGIGWHYETGVQTLRLVLAGTFDRFPDLQLVLGHWGEVVLFYLERVDGMSQAAATTTGLRRPVSDYFRTNVSVTPSGLFSPRYLGWAREVLGVDRILFSADYPYKFEPDGAARRYLESADLDDAGREAIAHGNWDRMVAAIRR